jgi:hypothetical protein
MKRIRTSPPKDGARIRCGMPVRVTKGRYRGRIGKAMLVTGSMWFVDRGDIRLSLHRTSLERIEVAA